MNADALPSTSKPFPRDRAHYDRLNRVCFHGVSGPEISALDFQGVAATGNVTGAGLDQFSLWQHPVSIRFSAVSDADLWRIWDAAEAQDAAIRAEEAEAARAQAAADAASKAAKAAKRAARLEDEAEQIGFKTRIFRNGLTETYFVKIRIQGEVRFEEFEREVRNGSGRFKSTNALTRDPAERLRRLGLHQSKEKYLAGFNTDLLSPYARHEYATPRDAREAIEFDRRLAARAA